MVRVGIDSGCGGIQGPIFSDYSFEYIPIPDWSGNDERKYGNVYGKKARKLVEYFPKSRQKTMAECSIHFDPEFNTFTYGDPTRLKSSLQRLVKGDMLIFYCGLAGWGDFKLPPALYLIGYFEVEKAGKAMDFSEKELKVLFGENYHVRHKDVIENEKESLVLVKGSSTSRLLKKATLFSSIGKDCSGRPLKMISPEMQQIFGGFNGKTSFQRSPPRWVDCAYVSKAANYIRMLS